MSGRFQALAALLALCGLLAMSSASPAAEVFDGVERIVAVGDVHGDLGQFVRVLRDAGVIDGRNRWRGGKTHLVQLGDVPDRGPDTRAIMDLLMKLERQARRAGGRVHALVGNHEAMNVVGDLRYVHPGEFAAFVDRKSHARQDAYLRRTIEFIKRTRSEEEWPAFDEAWEAAWREQYPLGFVEHRQAWSPKGKYGRWVAQHNALVKINGMVFVHGGISPKYAGLQIGEINDRVRAVLSEPPTGLVATILDDPDGPLWYRALATSDTSEPAARAQVDAVLAQLDATHIVVGHTPITGTVLPRFDGRVIVVDVGLADFYGSRTACLVVEGGQLRTIHRGSALPLPASDELLLDYLRAAAELDPPPSPIDAYIERLLMPEDAQDPPAIAD